MVGMERSPGSEETARAPKGVLFLSPGEVAEMMGDFGVQRALRLMNTDIFPIGERGTTIVQAVINASAQQHPPQTPR